MASTLKHISQHKHECLQKDRKIKDLQEELQEAEVSKGDPVMENLLQSLQILTKFKDSANRKFLITRENQNQLDSFITEGSYQDKDCYYL